MSKPAPNTRDSYPHHLTIPTRWADNDIYGHVNNAVYYVYFDTVVNRFLVDAGVLNVGHSETVGLVVDTGCSFFSSISFPDDVVAGLRVAKIGTSSVRYEIGLFRNSEILASAQGHFVHVYVDETTRRPVAVSEALRLALAPLVVGG